MIYALFRIDLQGAKIASFAEKRVPLDFSAALVICFSQVWNGSFHLPTCLYHFCFVSNTLYSLEGTNKKVVQFQEI